MSCFITRNLKNLKKIALEYENDFHESDLFVSTSVYSSAPELNIGLEEITKLYLTYIPVNLSPIFLDIQYLNSI